MLSSTNANPRSAGSGEAVPGLSVLLCHAGPIAIGLPLRHVVETMRPLSLEPLAGMPPFMAGLSVVRGVSVPVVRLARLLGHELAEPPTRFVILDVDGRRVALALERVLGVRSIRADAVAELPPLLGAAQVDFVVRVGALDARLLVVLESGRVVPEAVWESLRSQGERA